MDKKIVSFVIKNPKMISVNDQYIHPVRKTKSGRYTSYFAKSPYLKEVQKFYEEELNQLISDEDVSIIKNHVDKNKGTGVCLNIIVGMPKKDIYDSDISNYIKSIEDCITRRTGIDDSYNLRVSAEKVVYENDSNHWILKVIIFSTELNNFKELQE